MMRKTLIYLILAIRAVFLFAKNSFREVFPKMQVMGRRQYRTFLILSVFLAAFNFQGFSQIGNCPPGQRVCRDGECHPARECGQGIPPPPGLPLDSKLPFLLIAGLGLGVYYWRSKKTA